MEIKELVEKIDRQIAKEKETSAPSYSFFDKNVGGYLDENYKPTIKDFNISAGPNLDAPNETSPFMLHKAWPTIRRHLMAACEAKERLKILERGETVWDQQKDVATMIDDGWRKKRDAILAAWDEATKDV